MLPAHSRQRIPSLVIALALLVLVSLTAALLGTPAAAKIVNNQPTSPVASVVDCIRSGANLGEPSDFSPRFAVACMGSAWDRNTYNFDTVSGNGDATRTFPAIVEFGDGLPDGPNEPGHATMASVGNDGSSPGTTGVGTVFGLAYSSGSNPAVPAALPATQRREHLFASAYLKRVTRFGVGGPGGIYFIDPITQRASLYVQVPGVVAGPATVQPGPAGWPNTPGDGSAASFPNSGWPGGTPYTPELGGVHVTEHDAFAISRIGKASLGGLTMSQDERYLAGVNLHQRSLFFIDTWSTAFPPPVNTAPIDANVAACPGGNDNFRPFAITYDHPTTLPTAYVAYVGYVCSAENTQNRADLRAGVLRIGSGVTTRVLDFPLAAYDAQRADPTWVPEINQRTPWYPWSDSLYVTPPSTRQQPMLTDIAFAEDGSMLLGFRSRTSDMGATAALPSDFVLGEGDLLRAPSNGSGGWNAPSTAVPELYRDEGGFFNPGQPRMNDSTAGAIAYVPGTASGTFGGEVVTTAAYPHLTVEEHTSGALWFNTASGGYPTAREKFYNGGSSASGVGFKASGLGDLELLCAWRAIGNRVWRDTNGNGIQDAGEPDLSNVRLQLLNSGGTVIATVTTGTVSGAGDLWRFYIQPFQTYSVRIDPTMFNAGQPLAGLSLTSAFAGSNPELDSDANASGVISIPAGPRSQVNLSYDFGLVEGGDIAVTKTGPATARPGGTIAYTLTITNNGPGQAQNVRAVDTLPAGTTYVHGSASPAHTSVSGQVVTWNLGTLAAGASRTITFNATVATSQRTAVTNSVTIDTTSSNDILSNNTSTHITNLVWPNVRITKTGPATVRPNGTLAYSLSYGNNGTASAASVIVQDTLPAGVTFVSSTPAPTSVSGQVITWNLGTVANGATGTITLNALAATTVARGATLTNTVTISTTDYGDTPTDNSSSSTSTVVAPNVFITKAGTASVRPNGDLTYTLSYGNNQSVSAAGVVVVDTLPAGVSFVSSIPAPTSVSGQTVTWNLGTVNANATGTITLVARAAASSAPGTVLTNNVSISTTDYGDTPTDNSSSSTSTVVAPNIRVTKIGPARVTAGDQFTYSLSYGNNGTASAAGVVVVDTLPAGVSFVSSTPAPTSQSGQTVTWNAGTVNAGATGTISLVVQASAVLLNGATVTNAVAISTTDLGDNSSDNQSSWDTLIERADVAISKASPTTFPTASGTLVTYHLDYSNNGPATALNVVVTDSVPVQLSGVTWSCASGCTGSGSGSAISVTLGSLPAGGSGRIVVTGTATTSLAREAFTNTARIATSTPEHDLSNNESSALGEVWTSDLLIIKDADPIAVAGTTFAATLTVRNQGPAPATSVQVVDTLPVGVSFVSSTPAPTSVSGQTVTWNLGTLADLEERTITLTLRAAETLDGGTSLVNVATTSAAEDRDPTNNTDDATTLIRRQADLRVEKTGPVRVTAGAQIAYTLSYTNDGPSQARAVLVTDTLPDAVTFVSSNPAPSTVSGQTLTWGLGNLDVGASGTISLIVATEPIQFDATLNAVNQAVIQDGGTDDPGGGGSNNDPDLSNNTDDHATNIETADLVVIKTMPDFAVAGLDFDATVVVENVGPADAYGVTLRDFLPPNMTIVSADPPVSIAPGRWNLGTIPAGGQVTVALRLIVPSTTPRDTVFTNRVIVDTTTPDRDETNNLHQDATTVRPNADLRIEKTGTTGPVLSGAEVSYTLDYTNAGPSLAEQVTLSDTLPNDFTLTSAVPAATSQSGSTLTWNLGDMDVGASGTITVIGTLTTTEAIATLTNTARIGSPTDDPDSTNNESDHPITVQTVDLSIIKTGDGQPVAGLPYRYTLTVQQAGAATATGVTVVDTLPASLALVSATPAPASQSGQTFTWELGDLAPGDERVITVEVMVSPAARGPLTNTATVDSPEPDRDPTNNTSTHEEPLQVIADLSVEKTGTVGPVLSGAQASYTLDYTNAGPSLAEQVTLTDTIPAGFTLDSADPEPTTQSATELVWALGDLAPGASGTITVTGTLVTSEASATLVNVARIDPCLPCEFPTDDPDPTNNESDHPITVQTVDLSITKVGDGLPVAGLPYTYTLTIGQAEAATATGVTVTDILPASLALVSATPAPASQSGQTFTWELGDLAPGDERVITVEVMVSPAARGPLTNTATVDSPEPDRDPTNNTSTHEEPLQVIADLSVEKTGTAGPVRSGSAISYTLTYRNAGPSLAEQTQLTDVLPDGFTLTDTAPAATSQDGQTLTWALGDLAPGTGGTILVRGTILGDGVSTERVNVARIVACEDCANRPDDPDPTNNDDDHPITVLKPDLRVTKTNGVDEAQPGDLLTYAIVVRNDGLALSTGITVTETPPAGEILPGDGWVAGSLGTYTQAIAQLNAGASVTLTLRVQLDNPLPAGMTTALNIVQVTDDGSTGDDPTPDNNQSRDDDPLISGSVGDLIWFDRNQNGSPDPGEPGLGNVTLHLLDPDAEEVLAEQVTGPDGSYTFGGLRLGRYAIRIDPVQLGDEFMGYTITTEPIPVTALTHQQRENMGMDIGLYSPTAAVDLAYLRAERQADGTVTMRWGTLNERDTDHFVVKRTTTSTLPDNAVTVGQRPSIGSAGGDYTVIDRNAPANGPLFYWLVEVELDGTEHVYGPAQVVTVPASGSPVVYLPLITR